MLLPSTSAADAASCRWVRFDTFQDRRACSRCGSCLDLRVANSGQVAIGAWALGTTSRASRCRCFAARCQAPYTLGGSRNLRALVLTQSAGLSESCRSPFKEYHGAQREFALCPACSISVWQHSTTRAPALQAIKLIRCEVWPCVQSFHVRSRPPGRRCRQNARTQRCGANLAARVLGWFLHSFRVAL